MVRTTTEAVECESCGNKTSPEVAYAEWNRQDAHGSAVVCDECFKPKAKSGSN